MDMEVTENLPSQAGPAPLQREEGQGNVEYLSCAHGMLRLLNVM